MKWNQTVKDEIIKEAKETANTCLIAGFSHSYGTAEEFENDNSKMIAKKNAFFAKTCATINTTGARATL